MHVVIKPHLPVTTWKTLKDALSRGKNVRYFYRGDFLHNAQTPLTHWEKLMATRGVPPALPALVALQYIREEYKRGLPSSNWVSISC